MDTAAEIAGLVLVLAGGFGAGFEYRMLRAGFRHQILTPAAQWLRVWLSEACCGLALISLASHDAAVTWTIISLPVVLMILNVAALLPPVRVVRVPRGSAVAPKRGPVRVMIVRERRHGGEDA